jgi:N utilization substance protein A
MKGSEKQSGEGLDPKLLLRLVDQMQHEKNVKRDVIFEGIEAALQMAAQKHFGEETDIVVTIDRDSGQIHARKGEEEINTSIFDPTTFGRIVAQSAKQVMIQKIREAESNSLYEEYSKLKGELIVGAVQRHEGGAAIVSLGKTEAILPRGEQIPGETHHIGERIKAVILEVKRAGQRVKIILSRTHPDFVRRLFENEIPEIAERIIEIKAIAREAGYRTKIAVSSIDLKVDCVGACVGVRGSRIKNVVDELGGERIDIVRWNDSLQVLIPNALQPAQVEDVFLYARLGRAIVLVKEDQLSLAIGRRGQNVRLASKLVGWDIEIMTTEELTESIEKAQNWFLELPAATDEMVEAFITEGFLSFTDLTFVEPAELAELANVTEDQAEEIIAYAEEAAERVEAEAEEARVAEAAARAAAEAAGETVPAAQAAAPQAGAALLEGGGRVQDPKLAFQNLFRSDVEEAAPPEQEAAAAADQAAESAAPEQEAAAADQAAESDPAAVGYQPESAEQPERAEGQPAEAPAPEAASQPAQHADGPAPEHAGENLPGA